MSIVAVHGPNTMFTTEGGGAPIASSPAGATATKSVTDGLTFAFSFPNPGARPAADFDWTFTGQGGNPAAQADKTSGTVTFLAAGAGTIVCTVSGATAPPPTNGVYTITVEATAGVPRDVEPQSLGETPPNGNGAYYPSDHTVDEVKAEADANADDQAYIQSLLDAERADKNRSTLVAYLEGLLPYVPGDHTVPDVVQYATDHPDELEAIIASETAGKNRTTLLSQLEALRTA